MGDERRRGSSIPREGALLCLHCGSPVYPRSDAQQEHRAVIEDPSSRPSIGLHTLPLTVACLLALPLALTGSFRTSNHRQKEWEPPKKLLRTRTSARNADFTKPDRTYAEDKWLGRDERHSTNGARMQTGLYSSNQVSRVSPFLGTRETPPGPFLSGG